MRLHINPLQLLDIFISKCVCNPPALNDFLLRNRGICGHIFLAAFCAFHQWCHHSLSSAHMFNIAQENIKCILRCISCAGWVGRALGLGVGLKRTPCTVPSGQDGETQPFLQLCGCAPPHRASLFLKQAPQSDSMLGARTTSTRLVCIILQLVVQSESNCNSIPRRISLPSQAAVITSHVESAFPKRLSLIVPYYRMC